MLSVWQSLFPKLKAAGFQLYFTSNSTCCLNFCRCLFYRRRQWCLCGSSLRLCLSFFYFSFSLSALSVFWAVSSYSADWCWNWLHTPTVSLLALIKSTMSGWVWFHEYLFISHGGKKQRQMDGIIVISIWCIFYFTPIWTQYETCGNFMVLFIINVYVFFVCFLWQVLLWPVQDWPRGHGSTIKQSSNTEIWNEYWNVTQMSTKIFNFHPLWSWVEVKWWIFVRT